MTVLPPQPSLMIMRILSMFARCPWGVQALLAEKHWALVSTSICRRSGGWGKSARGGEAGLEAWRPGGGAKGGGRERSFLLNMEQHVLVELRGLGSGERGR